jgi:hypothetical protein
MRDRPDAVIRYLWTVVLLWVIRSDGLSDRTMKPRRGRFRDRVGRTGIVVVLYFSLRALEQRIKERVVGEQTPGVDES